MSHLLEYESITAKILSERTTEKGKEVNILVKWQQADSINKNGRLYPRSISISVMGVRVRRNARSGLIGASSPSNPHPRFISSNASRFWGCFL
jgi:hypothetical protein